jgi:hypothetical protein
MKGNWKSVPWLVVGWVGWKQKLAFLEVPTITIFMGASLLSPMSSAMPNKLGQLLECVGADRAIEVPTVVVL